MSADPKSQLETAMREMLQEIRIRTAEGAIALSRKIQGMGPRHVALLEGADPRALAGAVISAIDVRGVTIEQAAAAVIAAMEGGN